MRGVIMGLTFLADKPSQVTAEMSEMIQEAGIGTDYTLYNVNRMFEENRSILFVIHVFTYVFGDDDFAIAAANVSIPFPPISSCAGGNSPCSGR